MTRLMTLLCAWLCAMAFLTAANPAQATGTNFFSYVSNAGSDSGTCSTPATACASFAYALTQTGNYGEIDCVNTGFYQGGLMITQSVTIDCGGSVGTVLNGTIAPTGEGIILINGSGIVVRLRNLSINREGYGLTGIDAVNMAALYVENCVITNQNHSQSESNPPYLGIRFEPTANAQLFVSNSVISNNGASSSSLSGGIYIVPGSGVTAEVSVDRSEISGNYYGIVGDGRSGGIIKGTISDSVVSGSTENGITVISSGSSVVFMTDQTKVTNNSAAGLFAGGSNAGIVARNTTVYGNAIGLDAASGAALVSYGNNSVNGNTTNGTFTATVAQQ